MSFLTELKTSHTAFYHSLPKEFSATTHDQCKPAGSVAKRRDTNGCFWMCSKMGLLIVAGIRPGDILEAVDGTPCLPPSTPYFGIGQTHKLLVAKVGTESATEIVVEVPKRKGTSQRPPLVEPKSPIHAKIGQNIGLLKIAYFPGAMGMRFATALDRAVNDLKKQKCDRLIVDLRGNIGGSLGFARLASYMCPGQIAIGHSLTPKRLRDWL